jgi:hypothetical protein
MIELIKGIRWDDELSMKESGLLLLQPGIRS